MKSSEKVTSIVYFDRKYVYTSHNGVVPNLLKLEHILSLKTSVRTPQDRSPVSQQVWHDKYPSLAVQRS